MKQKATTTTVSMVRVSATPLSSTPRRTAVPALLDEREELLSGLRREYAEAEIFRKERDALKAEVERLNEDNRLMDLICETNRTEREVLSEVCDSLTAKLGKAREALLWMVRNDHLTIFIEEPDHADNFFEKARAALAEIDGGETP